MPKRLTTIRLDTRDDEAIQRIRQRWGLSSDTDAIRLAVRVLAEAERLEIVIPDGRLQQLSPKPR